MVGDGLEEFADPEPTGVSTRSISGKGVVCSNHLVAKRHIGLRAKKQGAIVGHLIQKDFRVSRYHLDMLGTDLVGFGDHLLFGVCQNDASAIFPGDAGHVGRWQYFQLSLDLGGNRFSE